MTEKEIGLLFIVLVAFVIILVKLILDYLESINKARATELTDLALYVEGMCENLGDKLEMLSYKISNGLDNTQEKLNEDKSIEYDDITQFVDGITSVQVKPSRYVELLSSEVELLDLKLKLSGVTDAKNN